jgi:phosphatidylglycerol:prolipoprotein diacylglycerol transferase
MFWWGLPSYNFTMFASSVKSMNDSLLRYLPVTISAAFYTLGYLSGVAAFVWMARKRGLATSGILAIMGAGLLGGLLAANVVQLATGSPGKTVLGAVAGGYLAVVWYKRRVGIVRPTGDLFAVALCVGEAVGRWGCYFGGCCYGKVCTVPWAVWQHGAWRHPAQVYLSISCSLILGWLWLYSRTSPPENGLFFLQGVLYCVARFMVEFWREGNPFGAGLTLAQWGCLAGIWFFGVRLTQLVGAGGSKLEITLSTPEQG